MSSLSRNVRRAIALASVGTIGAIAALPASAADGYFAPFVNAGAEYNTNRDLVIGDEDAGEGYRAELGAILGMRGPRSGLDIRPRYVYIDYPNREDLDSGEQYVDAKWNFVTQRSRTDVVAKYSRRDAYEAELVDANFDPFDPNDPVVGETGQLIASNTRTRYQLRPSYEFEVTERTGLGLNVVAENVRYDSDIPNSQTGYDFQSGELFVRRTLDPRTSITLGGYATNYESSDDLEETKSYGVALGWQRRWSEVFTTDLRLIGERSETELATGISPEDTTDYGFDALVVRRWEVSRIIFSGGRTFSPSGSGKTITDQIRAQYTRSLSERLELNAAGRGIRSRSQIEEVDNRNDRDYLRADLSLQWQASRTWFVEGGYGYIWQEYTADPSAAENHQIYIRVGYEGLLPDQYK